MTTARDVTEPQLEHLTRCLDRSIGTDARSTMMTMLSAANVADLATKADVSALGLRMDEMEKRTEIRLDELDKRLNGQIETLRVHVDQKLDILENKISTNTMRAINRHLTFSVTAMSAISGMITVLAR